MAEPTHQVLAQICLNYLLYLIILVVSKLTSASTHDRVGQAQLLNQNTLRGTPHQFFDELIEKQDRLTYFVILNIGPILCNDLVPTYVIGLK